MTGADGSKLPGPPRKTGTLKNVNIWASCASKARIFRHHTFRADLGTDHHGQYEEDSVHAFHRRPERSRIIQVTHDEIGSCPPQRAGGGRIWVAHQGADRPITFKQVLCGRAAFRAAPACCWGPPLMAAAGVGHPVPAVGAGV